MKKCLLLFPFLLCSYLHSDVLHLNDGTAVEGNFISEEPNIIVFESNSNSKRYPKYSIKQLEMGFTGSTLCYKLVSKSEDCSKILHILGDNKIVTAPQGKGNVGKEIFPLNEVEYVVVKKIRKNDKISIALRPGLEIEAKSKTKKFKGVIESRDTAKGSINLKTKASEVETLTDKEITEIRWENEEIKFSTKFLRYSKYLIPGIPQFPDNRWKGAGMFTAFLLFAAAIPIEYSAAQSSLKNDSTILPFNGSFIVVSGFGSNPSFDTHQRNMIAAGAGLGLLYAYHFYDVWKMTRPKEPGTSFDFRLTPQYNFQSDSMKVTPGAEFKFNYNF